MCFKQPDLMKLRRMAGFSSREQRCQASTTVNEEREEVLHCWILWKCYIHWSPFIIFLFEMDSLVLLLEATLSIFGFSINFCVRFLLSWKAYSRWQREFLSPTQNTAPYPISNWAFTDMTSLCQTFAMRRRCCVFHWRVKPLCTADSIVAIATAGFFSCLGSH